MRYVLMASVMVVLAACGGTKLLGSRTPPDETQVIDGPSLALPPDFNLKPPTEGDDYEAMLGAQKTREAQALILGGSVTPTMVMGVSATDQWLVQQAGTADTSIRDQLKADAAAPKPEAEKTFWERIMGKKSKE
ncbi:MAG: DUF3035 domain-containing protein [Alphaproteobacteria bacterium]